ncbi:FAD-binding oxidoreductase [Phytomonospora endophytica]|uniref:FAD/FMN-containing dehydrogenase n=1 Tax=Phytomonospora endophytica TaxID=714109 RepID=A0A841G1U1_9ACTN|nr:FAD-binding oxidoreductase [Phytomonospora endophytica]MBB6038659.1 FAD/FMN-containing dehydrogenase [Phytomonospora endophytica]GIG69197.1 oxidoreductase [Phytomonospora endophytica]
MKQLTERFTGPVLTPDDERYDAERTGWQTARAHRPDLVVGAATPADVQAAVKHAADHGLPVAVQGTGHASAAVAAEGGVLITTERMAAVRVDPDAATAWVAAGTRWNQVVSETAPFGLAPLSGSAPHVGAVSYTLGGGLGLLSRTYGYAADHVRSLDVVTADGHLRHVTPDNEPDLFWALRGGRDNFGVVTGMEIDLVPVTTIYGGTLIFSGERTAEIFDAYLQWTATVPEAMNSSIASILSPNLPAIPEPLRGRRTVHIRISYTAGDLATAESLVAPLRTLGTMIDTVGKMAFADSGVIHNDPVAPTAAESSTAMLGDLNSDALPALLEQEPTPHIVELRHLGGAMARPPAIPNAVGNRDARFLLNLVSPLASAELSRIRTAHERIIAALGPWDTGGRFLNYLSGHGAASQVRAAYSPADYRRLSEIKAVYDPHNTFRLNHNIAPAKD